MSQDNILKVEHFVPLLYKKSTLFQEAELINATRKGLFLSKGFDLEKLPPTKDALTQQIQRCIYLSNLSRSQYLQTGVGLQMVVTEI